MKKLLLTSLMAATMAVNASAIEVGAGLAPGDKSGNMATIFASLDVLSNIGLRAEYTKNISEHKEFSREDLSRMGIFATYTLPLTSAFSVTPKAGIVKTDGEFEIAEITQKLTDSETKFTYGLELNYDYNENIAIFLGYTDYGDTIDLKKISKTDIDNANVTVGIKIRL